MKNIRYTLLAALVLAAPTVAQAQAPGTPGGPPVGAPGAPGTTAAAPAADTGAVTNTVVESTTTTSNGIEPGGIAITDETMTTELANTGGEPMLLSLMGLSMVAGAFFLRRRVTG